MKGGIIMEKKYTDAKIEVVEVEDVIVKIGRAHV